jgi:hypothetical protein
VLHIAQGYSVEDPHYKILHKPNCLQNKDATSCKPKAYADAKSGVSAYAIGRRRRKRGPQQLLRLKNLNKLRIKPYRKNHPVFAFSQSHIFKPIGALIL